MITIKCLTCKKPFDVLEGVYRQQKNKYCSSVCYDKSRKGKKRGKYQDGRRDKVCEQCKNNYSARSNKQRFCSRVCLYVWLRGTSSPSWKGGRIITSGKYIGVYMPDHPQSGARDGYVLEHRLVMEKKIGRYLQKDETVHHINGDTKDNRIENLQLRHGRHGKGVAYQCLDCGSHNVKPVELSK